jgi:DUF4097 and DUF4098 domain-containing protein YvlB
MSDSGVGFGGFLIGLGVGWYLFQYIEFSFDIISYILIILGSGIIISALFTRGRRPHPISGAVGGIVGGLILAIFITQGFGLITDITNEFTDISTGTYRVSDTFTLTNPVTSESIELDIKSVNGAIDVYQWTEDNIKLELEVKAKGNTDSEAEANLAKFEYNLDSSISGDIQQFTLTFPISMREWSKYVVSIHVYVPPLTTAQYNLETTNGGINLDDVIAEKIDIKTTNGVVTFSDVASSIINVETTNGGISGSITSSETSFSTTNGPIELRLSKISGEHSYTTTNGGIKLNLPTGTDVGYSITLESSVGAINVNIPNMQYSVDRVRTKIGETSNYSTKQIRIKITADTTIGGINLN